ncbi:MAG TPA: DUF1553 domain-containing protein [Longimicrobiaceae bacterium]
MSGVDRRGPGAPEEPVSEAAARRGARGRRGSVSPAAGLGMAAVLAGILGVVALRGEAAVDFNAEVRPILNGKCISCHGGVKRSAGFGVLFREDALVAGESGRPGIVPGDADASEMIRRITHADPSERMPKEGDPLSEAEIRTLRRWIDQGAEWGEHWAYRKPEASPLPAVEDEAWATGAIDRFVLARLEDEELAPSPAADCHTLMRRVSLDLIGLPPAPEESDAFCAGPTPEAYAAVVDRLLASPRYGEHWASMWLDLARYADTKGYEKDQHRDIWPYRDWVIRALNEDMPFDRFTLEQLAGDLLPGATDEQILATAYHRNTMTNDEDGTDDEEFRIAAVIDRVNTTMEVWQGTTMGCVQCHSHPYDPFRHEEYYRLFAFFNNTADGDRKDDSPLLPRYGGGERARIAELLARLDGGGADSGAAGRGAADAGKAGPGETAAARRPAAGAAPSALAPRIDRLFFPLGKMPAAEYSAADSIISTGDYVAALDAWGWVRYDDFPLGGVGEIALGYSGNSGRVELRLEGPRGPLIGAADVPPSAPRRPPGGLALEPTLRVPITPTSGRRPLVLVLIEDGARQLRVTSLAPQPARSGSAAPGSAEELEEVRRMVAEVPTDAHVPVLRELPADRRRVTRVFERGNWLVHGDTVAPGVPATLPPLPADAPRDRRGLAGWLTSRDNPLTARVTVNRLWARLFGSGIVPTLSDFGTQGEPPSHPALLDWMAVRLMDEHAWSLKAMLREMVLSSTYRQASRVTPELLERDPGNRLLARGPRLRLTAEQVRDQALAVAGLLSDSMYGPGVMPPQPPGVWNSPYNSREWRTSEGEDRYRRAVYTYWKRTAPYPSLMAFDAPSREVCVAQRGPTNTPLQALVTLNDPVYVEAAQGLARRMSRRGGDVSEQIRAGYRWALQRDPDGATLARLVAAHESAAASYRTDADLLRDAVAPYRPYDAPADSSGYVSARPTTENAAPEHEIFALPPEDSVGVAALTTVATVIMNLDGFLTRD